VARKCPSLCLGSVAHAKTPLGVVWDHGRGGKGRKRKRREKRKRRKGREGKGGKGVYTF